MQFDKQCVVDNNKSKSKRVNIYKRSNNWNWNSKTKIEKILLKVMIINYKNKEIDTNLKSEN